MFSKFFQLISFSTKFSHKNELARTFIPILLVLVLLVLSLLALWVRLCVLLQFSISTGISAAELLGYAARWNENCGSDLVYFLFNEFRPIRKYPARGLGIAIDKISVKAAKSIFEQKQIKFSKISLYITPIVSPRS